MKFFTYSHLSQAIDNSPLSHLPSLIHLSLISLLRGERMRVESWENERMRRERREDEVRDEIMKGERIRWEDER